MREDYPASYRILLQVYDKKGETNSAIDAAIEYVDKDSDPSWRLLINAGKKNLNYAVANMRAKMKSSDKPIYWRALIAELYYSAGKYELALKENIKLEEEAGKDDRLYTRKAECYRYLGMHEAAIAELDHVLAKEGDWNHTANAASVIVCWVNLIRPLQISPLPSKKTPALHFRTTPVVGAMS